MKLINWIDKLFDKLFPPPSARGEGLWHTVGFTGVEDGTEFKNASWDVDIRHCVAVGRKRSKPASGTAASGRASTSRESTSPAWDEEAEASQGTIGATRGFRCSPPLFLARGFWHVICSIPTL